MPDRERKRVPDHRSHIDGSADITNADMTLQRERERHRDRDGGRGKGRERKKERERGRESTVSTQALKIKLNCGQTVKYEHGCS